METATPIVRRRGRPKAKPVEVQQEANVPEVVKDDMPATTAIRTTEVKQEQKKEYKKLAGVLGGRMPIIPFRGKEHVRQNEFHFFVNGNETNGYKLLYVYKDKNGKIKRSLAKTLKPKKRTERGSADRGILQTLKQIGVSGII